MALNLEAGPGLLSPSRNGPTPRSSSAKEVAPSDPLTDAKFQANAALGMLQEGTRPTLLRSEMKVVESGRQVDSS